MELDPADGDAYQGLRSAYELVPEASEKARSAFERTAELLEEELEVNPRDPSLLIILRTLTHTSTRRV